MKTLSDLMPILLIPNVFIIIATLCGKEFFKISRIPFMIATAIFVVSFWNFCATFYTLQGMTVGCVVLAVGTMLFCLHTVHKAQFPAFEEQETKHFKSFVLEEEQGSIAA